MSDAPQKCLYCGRLHQPKSDKDGFFCSRSCSVAFRLSLDPEYGEHYRANDTDPELAALRQTFADQAAEIERLTRLLDSGRLMWSDRCGGMFFDRDEIDTRMPSDPHWVIELNPGSTEWRDLLKGGAK